MTNRFQTRKVNIGGVIIGGGEKIAIQSMTNTRTADVDATVEQILRLEEAGCEIIRCAAPTMDDALAIKDIKKRIHIPLVADIHFDYRLAVLSIESGADKVRINPGNIGDVERVKAVTDKAKEYGVPIRIGVNSGSLNKKYLERDGKVTAKGLADSAMDEVKLVESLGFEDLVISIKSSNIPMTIEAHKDLAKMTDHPLHIGITEAGTLGDGMIKSAAGLGSLISMGIGDTIRVSLTADPVEEIYAAKKILKFMGEIKEGVEVISCPTCGRTQIDLIKYANEVNERLKDEKEPLKIAVMGCVVNGPGEAREADFGIAGGLGVGLIFKKGEILKKVPEEKLVDALIEEIENWKKDKL